MVTGRGTQLTRQIGEFLVSAELCRMGLISTTFSGNVPTFDILATDEKLRTIPIQVKTIRGYSWQLDATKFLDLSITEDGKQEVKGKLSLPKPNLICVLVNLRGRNQDEFYICRLKDLQEIVYRNYTNWLKAHGGRRPVNPKSTHCGVWLENVRDYRDKWEIIGQEFGSQAIP